MLNKVKIVSTASTYILPKEGQIVRQILNINSSGKCSVSFCEWTKDMKIRRTKTQRFIVEESIAKEILAAIETVDFQELRLLWITDAGGFSIKLCSDDNTMKTYDLTVWDVEYDGKSLSEYINEKLGRDDLWVFRR